MEPLDRYATPETEVENLKPLGSLAQSARGKEIGRARGILIGIGLLTMAVNGFLLYRLPTEIDEAARINGVGPADMDEFRRQLTGYGYLIYGAPALLGLLFFIFGLVIRKKPVLITITSLVLYIGATLAFALLNPASLAQGIIFKVIIVVALFRSIKAARAYESENVKAGGSGLAFE